LISPKIRHAGQSVTIDKTVLRDFMNQNRRSLVSILAVMLGKRNLCGR
jgi:hypothetical protein